MKKIQTLAFAICILFCACEERNAEIHKSSDKLSQPLNSYELTRSSSESGGNCNLLMHIGHRAQGCNGCVLINGRYVHRDCMGIGSECTLSASVRLEEISDNLYSATTTDTLDLTDQPFFNMPARSLCMQLNLFGKSTWLNIPAQLVYRDPVTRQFTLTGLFYTDYQYYDNE